MNPYACWDDSMLRRHEGQRLPLGRGSVALSYRLYGHDRVRTTFFVHERGRLHVCAYETGDTETLIRLLNVYVHAAEPTSDRSRCKSELN